LQNFTNALLLGPTCLWIGCSDTTTPLNLLATVVESQDQIVSENGELQLTRGTLGIQSISLVGSDGNVALLGPITLDLTVREQDLPLQADIPAGEYSGLHVELAPRGPNDETLDVDVQSPTTQEAVRVTSMLTMSSDVGFPEGPRSIAEGSEVQLRVQLRGMFFYLDPITGAVDGHYTIEQENGGNFLAMDLVNMFDLRVLP